MRRVGLLSLLAIAGTYGAVCEPDEMLKKALEEQLAARTDVAKRAAAIERFAKLAEEHPGAAAYAYLHARALIDTDTPRAIGILEKIAPDYALARIPLVDILTSGKFADRSRARQELETFIGSCPQPSDPQFSALLQRLATPELAAREAPKMRARVESDSRPDHERGWRGLWDLEFKAHTVPEHEAVRKQILADVKAIEARTKSPGAADLALVASGYQLAGDTTTAKKLDAEILNRFPDSAAARGAVARSRTEADRKWEEEHRPKGMGTKPEDWTRYWKLSAERAEEQLKSTPKDQMALSTCLSALAAVPETPEATLLEIADRLLAVARDPATGGHGMPPQLSVARIYLQKNVRTDSVAGLVEEGLAAASKNMPAGSLPSDRYEAGRDISLMTILKLDVAQILVDLAAKQEKPELARAAVAALDDVKTTLAFQTAQVWRIRAKLAELDRRKLDALLMYREAAASMSFNQREVDRLVKELGGTSATKDLLSKGMPAKKPTEAGSSTAWTAASKALPAFSLVDTQGKTWKLVNLEGKTVLINLWATWCAPCRQEHPHLQKLYDKLKDRTDLQVITFNVDDEVGKVQPYMKENHYTFPVLMAKSYVDDLIPSLSIPQNWVVDGHGKWTWQQTGFGMPEKWEASVMNQLEGK